MMEILYGAAEKHDPKAETKSANKLISHGMIIFLLWLLLCGSTAVCAIMYHIFSKVCYAPLGIRISDAIGRFCLLYLFTALSICGGGYLGWLIKDCFPKVPSRQWKMAVLWEELLLLSACVVFGFFLLHKQDRTAR